MHLASKQLEDLASDLQGELHYDMAMRVLYATDASVYRSLPTAVAYPKNQQDIQKLIAFATLHGSSLIPRAAGTSLAGQVVGEGIVVDVSKHFNQILEVNQEERWVRVEPGVIRDDLNRYLKPYGLFFAPETSTANRAMIGGMVGNNSCGTNSVVYKTTRHHLLELKTILSDGKQATFSSIDQASFEQKQKQPDREGDIYTFVAEQLSQPSVQQQIREEFPKRQIHRRNTGYAIDELLELQPFSQDGEEFNMCKLLAGSEGTLAFTTEIKLSLVPLPPPEKVMLCAHFSSLEESLRAVVIAIKHPVRALELMDKIVMDCTKENKEQAQNRFFVEGDPEGILMIEFGGETREEVDALADALQADLEAAGMAYAFPRIYPPDIKRAWTLRKAGLGLLANIPGDAKPVAVIEDTAVWVEELPEYIAEFGDIMQKYGQRSVHYAHAGAGELHLRPILDLKQSKHVKMFRDIAHDTAVLVKKYGGSLSGEHGDGRVRAEFLEMMVGKQNYLLLRQLKAVWDPKNIFNPGKIVDADPMDSSLRYEADRSEPEIPTLLNFEDNGGILRMAEKCNGSGDCRRSHLAGGTMCPSFMATRDEKDTTRARANILREFLTHSEKSNRFDHEEIKQVMDLCLSCKACKSDCPSNVDVASLKAEFQHQYYEKNGVPLRNRIFANIALINRMGSVIYPLHNFMLSNGFTSGIIKKFAGVSPQRSLPTVSKQSLRRWYLKNYSSIRPQDIKKTVYFFCDEFTDFNDAEIGIKAIKLLGKLGYDVKMPAHAESGRAAISKGLLKTAQKFATTNVRIFKKLVSDAQPLLGIEPSAILSFRDEYPRLVAKEEENDAKLLGQNCYMIDDFIAKEMEAGNINRYLFTKEPRKVFLHGHCHQKAIASVDPSAFLLDIPLNYQVEVIPSGCCGMAGSFGYEEEHYDVSMQIGELVLFPAVRATQENDIIAATGTSCRHQIMDGTKRKAKHPIEILYDALR